MFPWQRILETRTCTLEDWSDVVLVLWECMMWLLARALCWISLGLGRTYRSLVGECYNIYGDQDDQKLSVIHGALLIWLVNISFC